MCGRQARGQAFGSGAGGRQEHAQPAGAQAEARGLDVSQDRLRCAEPGSIARGHLPRWPQASAEGDRARPRRHRRQDHGEQEGRFHHGTTAAIAPAAQHASAAGLLLGAKLAQPSIDEGRLARSTRSPAMRRWRPGAAGFEGARSCCAAIRATRPGLGAPWLVARPSRVAYRSGLGAQARA